MHPRAVAKHFLFFWEQLSTLSMNILKTSKQKQKTTFNFYGLHLYGLLAKDIGTAMEEVIAELGYELENWHSQWRYQHKRTAKTKKANAGSADHYP